VPNKETLPLLLKQLGLPTMLRRWEALAETAQQEQWDPATYLAHLCEEEVANRYQNRVVRYTKDSKLPPGKTLATFDFPAVKVSTRLKWRHWLKTLVG